MIAKLICRFLGHRRGRRLKMEGQKTDTLRCPRCSDTWTRKARAPKAKA